MSLYLTYVALGGIATLGLVGMMFLVYFIMVGMLWIEEHTNGILSLLFLFTCLSLVGGTVAFLIHLIPF